MPVAARQTDPIQHSNALTGLLVGAAVGLALGAFVVCTGGLGGVVAVAVIGGGVAAGAGVGEVLGSLSISGGTVTGAIATGSGNTTVNSLPAARATLDSVNCAGTPPIYFPDHMGKLVAQGSSTVLINSWPASRVADKIQCGSQIQSGSTNVIIGGATATTVPIEGEVPGYIHAALFVIGIASAVVLAGPVVAITGLVGGMAGGVGGYWLGGVIFGEGSDGQKLMGLFGGFLGGFGGAKAGMGPAAWLGGRIGGPWGAFVKGGVPAYNQFMSNPQLRATDYINNRIPDLDYRWPDGKTPSGWSGRGALDAARRAGFATMEDTPGGQTTIGFVESIDGAPWDVQRPVWVGSSRAYMTQVAQEYGTINPNTGLPITGPNAGKPVPIFISEAANPETGIYFTDEQAVLLQWGVNIQEIYVPAPPVP
ncbi:MAG: PAAR domain-containing protein [Polyangiaceae bacterium]|nr:PAAR domain-containing protein [Polyangiaceae bacterium]